MTVNVSKPAVNVREKLAELDKPTGIAGEAMLRAETPQEQQALLGVGRRNVLINGGFDVWQRGTSISLAAGTHYSADRWTGYSSTTGRTYSQDTTEALSIGFKNCGKFVTGAAGPSFYQRVEDVRTFAGQTVTLSFWMKSNTEHTPVWGSLQQVFGSGGSGTVTIDLPELGMVTTEWKYFTATITLPSVEGKTIGSNDYLMAYPLVMNGSTTYWATGFQLELGKVATPFEHRSYGEELALCQRYYQTITSNDNFRPVAACWSPNDANMAIPFVTQMRSSPTVTVDVSSIGAGAEVYTGSWTAWDSYSVTPSGSTGAASGVSLLVAKTNAYTAKDAVFMRNFIIKADAEL